MILGISVDRKKELVREYVETHDLDWVQILNEVDNQGIINKLYHVPYYPTYFLVDPQGKISNHIWDPLDIVEVIEKSDLREQKNSL